MDWDKNFSKIVRETESNLAKVKERLSVAHLSGSLRELHTPALTSYTHSTIDGLNRDTQFNGGFSSLRKPTSTSYEPFAKDSFITTYNNVGAHEGSAFTNPQQSSMITLLHDKIDAQDKTIEALVQSVKRLGDEKEHYSRQVQELREDLAKLHNRVVERGIDLQTERKMEQWKQDVSSQISSLQTQLAHSRRNEENSTAYQGNQTTNIVRDIHDLKRYISSECDGLRYNIESVKTRLGRIEAEVPSTNSSNRGFLHGQKGVDQNIQKFLSGQPTQQYASFTSETDIPYLKGSIQSLRERLRNVESDIQLASSSKVIDKTKEMTRSRTSTPFDKEKKKTYLADLDLSDSIAEDHKLDVGADLSLDELNDSRENLLEEEDDIRSVDLEDVHTANTIDLNLSEEISDNLEADDDPIYDHELSIDDLS